MGAVDDAAQVVNSFLGAKLRGGSFADACHTQFFISVFTL